MTQKMRIRGTEMNLRVQDEVYPYVEAGIFYLRVVVLNLDGEPTEFLSIMPQDILYRTQLYTDERMQEIKVAATKANKKATKDFMDRMEEENGINNILADGSEGGYHG